MLYSLLIIWVLHCNSKLLVCNLVNSFVILLVLEEWYKFLVLLDKRHVAHMTDCLLLLLTTSTSFSELCDSSVSHPCLLINICIDLLHVDLILLHAPAPTTLQAKHHCAASNTEAA